MEHNNNNKQFYPKTFTTNILKLQFTGFQTVMAGWFASILTVDPFPPTSRMTFQAMPRTWVSSKQDPIFQNGNNKKQRLHRQLHSTKWSEYVIILIHIALNLKRIQGEGVSHLNLTGSVGLQTCLEFDQQNARSEPLSSV